jgi:glycosyltransferase involved in cell wall biosynthesis
VILKGYVPPDQLAELTPTAWIGLTLFEQKGMNQSHSLGNRFFDYMMAGVPQLCVNYPEYAALNHIFHFAHLIDDTAPETIAAALNYLLKNDVVHNELRQNCGKARTVLNWENETSILLSFYNRLFFG